MRKAHKAGVLNENPNQAAPGGSGGTFDNNKFSETQMMVNGEVVKATSETDVAMIKSMQGDPSVSGVPGGVVADLTAGGGVIADLDSGRATDMSGRELKRSDSAPEPSPEPQGVTLNASSL